MYLIPEIRRLICQKHPLTVKEAHLQHRSRATRSRVEPALQIELQVGLRYFAALANLAVNRLQRRSGFARLRIKGGIVDTSGCEARTRSMWRSRQTVAIC
jgi:hypothetical protein